MATHPGSVQGAIEIGEEAAGGLLERVAVTLGSTLDLREVLRRLAEIVHVEVSAQRCSIVLLDGDRLEPAVAIGPQADDVLWEAFRHMPPIPVGDERWEALVAGRVLAIDDARSSPLIPAEWVDRFDLRAMAVVPLLARGTPCGAMAVDWPEVRAIDRGELALLEAVAAYAGVAIHNASLHKRITEKSRALEHLVDVAAALNSSTSLDAVLDLVCDGFVKLLGAVHCSVNLSDASDPMRLRTLARRGGDWFVRLPDSGATVHPEEIADARELRTADAGPIVYERLEVEAGAMNEDGVIASAALFPLFGLDGLVGSVVAGFPDEGGPGEEQLETGQTLAELAAAAIGRADLHGSLAHRVRQLEILFRLAEVVSGVSDLDDAFARVKDVVEAEMGVRIRSLAGASPEVREVIGGREPGPEELAAIEVWRSALREERRMVGLRRHGEAVLVPLVFRDRVQGVMLVEVDDDRVDVTDEEFLLAVGSACAEILHQTSLRRALTDSEQRLAVTLERERIARDLHDSAGQLVTGIGLKLAGYLAEGVEPPWRARLAELHGLAVAADRELREAISSLLFVQVRREGLVHSLRDLCDRFTATTGIAVNMEVRGVAALLPADHEDALFRVGHEALSNVERHARAEHVWLSLRYGEDDVVLVLRDDGIGFPPTHNRQASSFGLATLERRLADLGGTLRTGDARPTGVRVEACLPFRALQHQPPERET